MGTPSAVWSSPVTPSYSCPAAASRNRTGALSPGVDSTRSRRTASRRPLAATVATATVGIPAVSREKNRISDPVCRWSCAAKVLSIRRAATTTPYCAPPAGSATGTPTAWYSSSRSGVVSIQSPSVVRPSSARPMRAPPEKSSSDTPRCAVQALRTPDPSTISTQSAPVCARSSSAWSSRLPRSSVRSASPIRET